MGCCDCGGNWYVLYRQYNCTYAVAKTMTYVHTVHVLYETSNVYVVTRYKKSATISALYNTLK